METGTVFIYLIGGLATWVIFYYVVKAAVRNGIKEAHAGNQFPVNTSGIRPEIQANPEQRELQLRYDKGEITFEDYVSAWNKLSQ